MSIIHSPCLSSLIPNLILGSNLDHKQKTLAPTLVDPLTLQITCVPNGSENIDEPTHLRGSARIEQWHHRVVSATRLRTIFPTCSPIFPKKKIIMNHRNPFTFTTWRTCESYGGISTRDISRCFKSQFLCSNAINGYQPTVHIRCRLWWPQEPSKSSEVKVLLHIWTLSNTHNCLKQTRIPFDKKSADPSRRVVAIILCQIQTFA